MKITKDDWMKLASPVVLIVVGILLACSIIDSVRNALQLIVGIVIALIGLVWLVFTIMAYKQRNSTKKSYTKTVNAKKSK